MHGSDSSCSGFQQQQLEREEWKQEQDLPGAGSAIGSGLGNGPGLEVVRSESRGTHQFCKCL